MRAQKFKVSKLTVRDDRTATLETSDGNNNVVRTDEIPYTDFPLAEITLWCANNVIYLPTEH